MAGRLWDWMLPEPLRHPDERLQRARRVLALCLAMSVWVPVFAGVYFALGAPTCPYIILAAGVLLLGIPLLQRATLSPTLAGNMLALLGTATYTGLALVTGGHNSPAAIWFISVPIMAVLLTRSRWGLFWTAATVALIGVLYTASELGTKFPVEFSEQGLRMLQCVGLAGLLVCVGALMLVFRTVEDQHSGALERALHLATAADRAKSEFLANMSHEIRTPMTAILGFTELLLEGNDSGKPLDNSGKREALDTIQRNGHHLLAVINDILDLSKIESGKLEIERLWGSPRQIVDEVVDLMRVRAEIKYLRIDARLEGALPEAIETDPTRLRQVLLNLLGNAIKFTEAGAVRLTTRWRPTNGEGGVLEFEVVDTGIGMSEEQIARLFQPFCQADNSTTRRFGGTGLGLSISKRLTEMLGGSIEVRSRLGEGSTFIVRLPVSIASALAAEPSVTPALVAGRAALDDRPRSAPVASVPLAAQSAPPDGRPMGRADEPQPLSGCRILLADDCVDNQRLIGHLLRRAGAELTVAVDGRRAVDAVHHARECCRPFDVILMDMQMPVLSGCEATRQLRSDGYQRPIIALTALSNVGEHRDCRAAGCDDVATKPIDRAALIGVIQRQLERTPAAAQ
ncbi:MAG TPA: ATP-binding protein [Pirellulales bacterium]|nr:ATP-binding protein [Pirellulales bacterium]